MLLENIDRYHRGQYDFFYLPIDFKNKCNMGYAFINFIDAIFIVDFFKQFNGKKWECFNSEKICEITYGRLQGKHALEKNFSNMSTSAERAKVRPLILNPPQPSIVEIENYRVKLQIKGSQNQRTFNNEWDRQSSDNKISAKYQ